ncbi:putative RNA-3'-phosphate cyclase 1 [Podospora fimiseda]|uniref:RNA-3'-phosphate cyclase 1 n=1 Tax=Podospora fimiseda TaxID=252190 RepID=A0AAN7BU98_9PEZI|nr:putative RNA-3'-phosphate cyclase 1 [Podospora fimiseda]
MPSMKPIELDGRTGEGGGQLVRIACALAAVAGVPIRITNVRGNREKSRGGGKSGGLKSQHVTAIEFLARATSADVSGLSVGGTTLEFRPTEKPSSFQNRNIKLAADSPASSTTLIFQAIFPFVLFAGNEKGEPITLEISGGTNVSFSPSFEYLDQVLLPTLETAFGIEVERELKGRGWSMGKASRGTAVFKINPLKPGDTLKFIQEDEIVYGGGTGDVEVETVDVSMIVPLDMIDPMTQALSTDLEEIFPDVEVNFKVAEDSGADSRIYVLLVARSGDLRFGRDILTSMPRKGVKSKHNAANASSLNAIMRKLVKELYDAVSLGGVVDEHLQDQMAIFQALAEGRTSFPRSMDDNLVEGTGNQSLEEQPRLRKEKANEPFGEGSMHAKTARWVTAELLPHVKWFNKGRICEGVGMHMEAIGKTR